MSEPRKFLSWWRPQDPLAQNGAERFAREGWNAAVAAAEEWLIVFAGRYTDIRAGALEAAAESLRRMKSPRTCDCCGQAIPEDR